jgi:oligogalacturonide transport system permease protein
MIIFLAGLKQIPNEFYEASRIDGANAVQRFVRITIPLLTPVIFFNLVMQTINALQEFTSAFVVTNGGPLKATYFYVLNLFQQGFHFFRMGYASALSWILFAIIIILTVAIFKTSPLWIHYEEGGDL